MHQNRSMNIFKHNKKMYNTDTSTNEVTIYYLELSLYGHVFVYAYLTFKDCNEAKLLKY